MRRLARADVERRNKAQIPDEEKARRADFVIDNSGSVEETGHQVQRIYAELKVLAKRLSFLTGDIMKPLRPVLLAYFIGAYFLFCDDASWRSRMAFLGNASLPR